jgi:hypothetical protein
MSNKWKVLMSFEKKGEKMSEAEQGIIDAVDALFGGSVDLSQYDYQQQSNQEEEENERINCNTK